MAKERAGDPLACLRKSYKKEGVTLKTTDLTKPEQATLAKQIFYTEPRDREFVTKKFLAQVMCKRQREAGLTPDVALRRVAGEIGEGV